MPAAIHTLQRLLGLVRAEARSVGDQHLGQPDNRVERRAQLVAHAGEELRLVLARLSELTALVLDLVEQSHVLDRDRGLVGEGRYKLDLLVGERPHLQARQRKHADRLALAQHRHTEQGPISPKPLRLDKGVVRVSEHIGNVNDFPFEQSTTVHRAALRLDRHVADHVDEFGREPVGLGAIEHAILLARDRRLVGVAKPRRQFD